MGNEAAPAPTTTPRWAWVLGTVVAAVPVVRMLLLVLDAHALPYNDYWPMMHTLLDEDGGLDIGGLFALRNEHPIFVAKFLYWLNVKVSGGSNVVLGLVVIGIALGQVAVLVVLARDLVSRWRYLPPVLMAAACVLLFGRQGAWHFLKSMSGTAWLSANLFTLLAIWCQMRRRGFLAIVFATLATFSYGTGLLAWPVIIVVGLFSGERWRRLVPAFVLGTAATIWLQVLLADLGKTANDRPPMYLLLPRGAEVIGAFLFPGQRVTDIRVGEVIVALGLVATGVVLYRLLRHQDEAHAAAPWVGLVAYGAGMGVLVAAGRNSFLWTGTAGRYAAIGAITLLGLIGLAVALLPERPGPRGGAIAVSAALVGAVAALSLYVFVGGAREVDKLVASHSGQDLLGVGLETRVVDGSKLWLGSLQVLDAPGLEDRLDKAGHDFHVDDDIDCGLLGSAIDLAATPSAPPDGVDAGASPAKYGEAAVPKATVVDGWVDGADVACALLVAPDGQVVGAGGHGQPDEGYGGSGAEAQEGRVWFSVLAPKQDDLVVVVQLEDGARFSVPIPR